MYNFPIVNKISGNFLSPTINNQNWFSRECFKWNIDLLIVNWNHNFITVILSSTGLKRYNCHDLHSWRHRLCWIFVIQIKILKMHHEGLIQNERHQCVQIVSIPMMITFLFIGLNSSILLLLLPTFLMRSTFWKDLLAVICSKTTSRGSITTSKSFSLICGNDEQVFAVSVV